MSASSKKKLRKELNAAALTEKQRKEQIEAKKLKVSSTIFIVIMTVILVLSLSIMIVKGVQGSGLVQKQTIAATVGDHKINTVVMNYYYADTVNNSYSEWYNMYGEYTSMYLAMMNLDLTLPLDEQIYAETGETWADYFMGLAVDRAIADYALYDLAMIDGFELSAADQLNLDSAVNYKEIYAMSSGLSIDDYFSVMYGPGSDRDSYYEYARVSSIASAYYNAHSESLVFDDAALRAYESGKENNYNSYTYASYYLSYSKFLEEGVTEPTNEQITAASELAKAEAEKLIVATTVEELDAAIAGLAINAESTTAASTKNENTLYTSVNSVMRDWVSDSSRKENDITMIANEVTSTDDAGNETVTINGYYVVLFQGSTDNTDPMANVRHLLVKFEGGTTDESGNTVYTDAEKAAAKEKAEGYLQTWKDGEATEDSFIALLAQYSADSSASTGGLYEDINPASPYVKNFLNWAIDPARFQGETGIIETEYGYHVMYYAGDDELSYRDYMLTNEMREAAMEEWYNGVISSVNYVPGNLSKVETGLTLSA